MVSLSHLRSLSDFGETTSAKGTHGYAVTATGNGQIAFMSCNGSENSCQLVYRVQRVALTAASHGWMFLDYSPVKMRPATLNVCRTHVNSLKVLMALQVAPRVPSEQPIVFEELWFHRRRMLV